MTQSSPTDFRIGDRVRLRKVHPCGGWIWKIVRLGADIGLVCETCGRRVLIERSTLERRLKSFLDRGQEAPPHTVSILSEKDDLPADALGLSTDDIIVASRDIEVSLGFFYLTRIEVGRARVARGQLLRVIEAPHANETYVLLEPVDRDSFELRFVPGGIRTQESYTGYAVRMTCRDIARDCVPGPGRDGRGKIAQADGST